MFDEPLITFSGELTFTTMPVPGFLLHSDSSEINQIQSVLCALTQLESGTVAVSFELGRGNSGRTDRAIQHLKLDEATRLPAEELQRKLQDFRDLDDDITLKLSLNVRLFEASAGGADALPHPTASGGAAGNLKALEADTDTSHWHNFSLAEQSTKDSEE